MIGPCELADLETPEMKYRVDVTSWPKEKEEMFRRIGMGALVLVGYDGPFSLTKFDTSGRIVSRLGHNRAIWPFTFARTKARKDTVSQNYGKGAVRDLKAHSMFRLWCLSEEARDQLADACLDHMTAQADEFGGLAELEPGWHDLGPNLNLDTFAIELQDIARRRGIPVFEDAALSPFVDRVTRIANDILASAKTPRTWDRVVDIAVERAMRNEGGRT